LVLELGPKAGRPSRRSQRGAVANEILEVSERRVGYLPLGEWDTWLLLWLAHFQCPSCGPTVEAVPWL